MNKNTSFIGYPMKQPIESLPLTMNVRDTLLYFLHFQKILPIIGQNITLQSFATHALETLKVQVNISAGDLDKIPLTGPTIIISNHPYGFMETLLLVSTICRTRQDLKIMPNIISENILGLQDLFILIDAPNNKHPEKAHMHLFQTALSWLKQGQVLCVFPSNRVALQYQRRSMAKSYDTKWNDSIAYLIRTSGALVLPVYFHECRNFLMQFAKMTYHPLLTALQPCTSPHHLDHNVELRIGHAISPKHLESCHTSYELMHYLHQRTFVLSSRKQAIQNSQQSSNKKRFPTISINKRLYVPDRSNHQTKILESIAEPVHPSDLLSEINQLPDEQCLLSDKNLSVYYAEAKQIPHVLREIGRLREIAFRGTGEGTGKAMDLDMFDEHYLHLFVWNKANNEIVGAYRLGLTDAIIKQHGIHGLYTSTLFEYSPAFIERISPAIELGRSFVRPEYQRHYSSLLMLWRGITYFVGKHPQYRMLFGPVSISNSYTSMSRELIMSFLRMQHDMEEMSCLVKPINPPTRQVTKQWSPEHLIQRISDTNELSRVINDIETDQKGISILLKQYLKLGARVLAFNVDDNFCKVLDVLILVDLSRSDYRTLSTYMDKELLDAFLAYHIGEFTTETMKHEEGEKKGMKRV